MRFLTITNKIKNENINPDFINLIYNDLSKCHIYTLINNKKMLMIEIDYSYINKFEKNEKHFVIEKSMSNNHDLFFISDFLEKNHNKEIIRIRRNDKINKILEKL